MLLRGRKWNILVVISFCMASVAACSSDREGESPPLTVETQIETNEQLTETKVPETTLEVEATTSSKSPVLESR